MTLERVQCSLTIGRRLRVQSHERRQAEVPDGSGPAFRVGRACPLVSGPAVGQYLGRLAAVALVWCDVAERAVAVLGVVPVDEAEHPFAGLLQGDEALGREPGTVLQRPEQRFGVGVVVAHPRTAARRRDSEVVEFLQECRCLHGAAVIGVQDQRLVLRSQVLPPVRLFDELTGKLAVLGGVDLLADDLAAEHVDDQVQIPPGAAGRSREPGDIPRPESVRRISHMGRGWPFAFGRLVTSTVVVLINVPQYAVERRLRGDIAPLVGVVGDDVRRRSAAVVGLVAQINDHSALQFGEFVMRDRAFSIRTGIGAHALRCAPALIPPHAHAHDVAGFGQPGTVALGLFDQGDGVLAIQEAGQSSSSLRPQIASVFFDSVSSAAVTASALSLRRSPRSSFFTRFRSALRSWRERLSCSAALAFMQLARQASVAFPRKLVH